MGGDPDLDCEFRAAQGSRDRSSRAARIRATDREPKESEQEGCGAGGVGARPNGAGSGSRTPGQETVARCEWGRVAVCAVRRPQRAADFRREEQQELTWRSG